MRAKPSRNPDLDLRELPLTPQEAYVATRLDGATDAHGLALGTGLPQEIVDLQMLDEVFDPAQCTS